MSAQTKLRFAVAALAASILTGMAPADREMVFFLLAGGIAGYLSPLAARWGTSSVARVAAGTSFGFLACYIRFAPWMGASMPLELQDAWAVTALVVAFKTSVLFAAMAGVYSRLRRDGLLGA